MERSHIENVVIQHLRANGDWNVNDWRDVAEALCREIERLRAVARYQREKDVGREGS